MQQKPVSYTHLDVYKRQSLYKWFHFPSFLNDAALLLFFLMIVDRCSFQVDVRLPLFLLLLLFRTSSCFLVFRVVSKLGTSIDSVYLYGSGRLDAFINAYTDVLNFTELALEIIQSRTLLLVFLTPDRRNIQMCIRDSY